MATSPNEVVYDLFLYDREKLEYKLIRTDDNSIDGDKLMEFGGYVPYGEFKIPYSNEKCKLRLFLVRSGWKNQNEVLLVNFIANIKNIEESKPIMEHMYQYIIKVDDDSDDDDNDNTVSNLYVGTDYVIEFDSKINNSDGYYGHPTVALLVDEKGKIIEFKSILPSN